MNPVDRQSIKHFVRTTLGCKCPDEVFESIAIERALTPHAALPYTRLVIGNRLLIYIHEAQPAGATPATVSRLAQRGLSERDATQFKRFRLVIAFSHPTQVLDDARTSFAGVVGDDQRAHLHILGRPVTKADWLECAYGSSNEVVLEQDKETREWVRRHFPADPHDAVK